MSEDALKYFYHNRSGIEIKEAFVQRADLARPAGHPEDIASCFKGTDAKGNVWPGCDFLSMLRKVGMMQVTMVST